MSTTHITRMLHFTQYTVVLSCGHRFEITKEEAEKQQLFIGKRYACQQCLEAKQ